MDPSAADANDDAFDDFGGSDTDTDSESLRMQRGKSFRLRYADDRDTELSADEDARSPENVIQVNTVPCRRSTANDDEGIQHRCTVGVGRCCHFYSK